MTESSSLGDTTLPIPSHWKDCTL